MAKRRRRRKKSVRTGLIYELYGILILIFAVIALAREGHVGRSFNYLCRFFVGTWDFIIPLICIYIALHVMIKRDWPRTWTTKKTGIVLIILGLLVMNHIRLFANLFPDGEFTAADIFRYSWQLMVQGIQPEHGNILTDKVGGGMIGAAEYSVLYFLFDTLGAKLVMYALFAIGFILITGLSYVDAGKKVRIGSTAFFEKLTARFRTSRKNRLVRKAAERSERKVKAGRRAVEADEPEAQFYEDYEEELPSKKRKKPVFLELFQPKQAAQDHIEEEDTDWIEAHEEAEEITVYQAGQNEIPTEPVITDFLDHPDINTKTASGQSAQSVQSVQSQPISHEHQAMREEEAGALEADIPASQVKPYVLPPFSLLSQPASNKNGEGTDHKANARKLEATMESFGVRAKVLAVVRGPAVTRYEIQPDVGVKVSRVVGLTDDIALALAAKDIRMEAPIPGKSAIGIEVPNSEVSVVTMREVMETSAFQSSASKLSITLGRDISGQPIVGNLAKMPHLLVAGATGSGKSVCINGIITSILYKAKPNEVKFMMIDPKMVELNVYNGIPHLLAPVVTDPRRASLALKKIVSEMERRYELFSKSGTRNIEGYNAMLNENGTEAPLPYYVVIVDELADLMMVAANDVEDAICRLAQMARAARIHLIIATQRPSVDVITGVIKANIPSRIAFGVSSQVDSRTILDMVGAEKLLGRGDMLYLPVGASKPIRVQGAFLSDQEVEAVVRYCRDQQQANYQEEMVPEVEEQSDTHEEFEDELYDQAVQIVLEGGQASVSLLQRRMRIGYTRAARLIDAMEAKGIIGPYEGSKPREVLISLEQYQQNRISS